ncbi:hypothetical protein [Sulfitobacter donghicola]|uniref:Uncharacterized protein n=1 Tax=Sulfitobacter donghicola DSW-25 = KCTC 12864 = JCM 14565 TaxID=1300350 RepID=A0A073II23_9RHOB|nr:hypothetical protein [Sulfitobacter donghicola]KEJ89151.1 hypothetical protein DSW25_12285 [Sulfitobacter donghicola DSW-25 = KCTC 12864 = JCM 14565]KIN67431.1 hypothetical protein Z948_1145 [Sulfitobacter donghicola DSW-25 = KCTC 12864 = JCM 14565]
MAERQKKHEMSGANRFFATPKKRQEIDCISKCGGAEKRTDKEMGSINAKTETRTKFPQASE